jgi:hypothetical protein
MHHTPNESPRHITPSDGDWKMPVTYATYYGAPTSRTLHSTIRKAGRVPFPDFTGERIYMQPFLNWHGEILLPAKYQRWIPTVKAMLRGIESALPMFLMVDQSRVAAGKSQRRGGVHIDGNWSERPGDKFNPAEILVLASDVEGCRAYLGEYPEAQVGKGGDCSAVSLSGRKRVRCVADYAYVGTVATLHESIPIRRNCERTLVRINVPVA